MQSHSQHTSSSATRRRDHSAAACPATWLVGLTLLFAATASDRVGARRLAGRFLPEYDFEAANERCFYHQRDANESGEGWWFGGAATSSSASDSHHGQPLVSESEGCRPNSAEDTSAEGGSSWLPGTESENTDTLGRGTSRSSQRTETRRRSRSRRRRSLSAGRRAQGDVSSDADVDPSSSSSTPSSRASRSTIEAAGDLPSVPPLAARFGTTVAAAAVMTAVGVNVAVRNVSVRSSPSSTPTPSARFVPLPATFASDCQPESSHRGAIPWCCGVCRSPVFQYGTKSCCVDCHAPFDRAAVRVFTGQLRKENTAAYIRWLFALVAPQVQLLHVEAHTTKGEQRTRGAAFVHVPTFEDGAELCQALNRRVFADVQVDGRSGHRVEGVWIVPEEEADRLAEYAASRANAIDRPNVLPRQPVVLEQRGKPSETAQPFRPWVATVPAATFTPMSANVLPPARSTPELVGSFAQRPPQVAVTYTHNPYAWNPFALLPMQHARVGARVSAAYQPSGWY